MNNFDIEKTAKKYVFERFPNASLIEKNKIVRDWIMKDKDAKLLIADFKNRVGDILSKKILDAGSGNGGISIAFAKEGALVSGVDIENDLHQISILQKEVNKISNVDFRLYDGVTLPFDDNYFDYALSLSVLEHTDDPRAYLNEILRVVKNNGFLYLGFPNKIWPKETHTGLWFLTYLPSFLRPYLVKVFKKNPLPDNNLHFYSLNDLNKFIEANGKYKWIVLEEGGSTKNIVKICLKKILKILGISHKFFLPHILVILKKVSNE